MKELQIYIVGFTDQSEKFHVVVLHATSPEDAKYCISEGWENITNIQVALLASLQRAYDHLEVGVMEELTQE